MSSKIDLVNLAGNEIKEQLEKFTKMKEEFENAKVKCAIIGRSGSGKSSLINAIAGKHIADIGEIETTMNISKPHEYNGLQFFDLPGSSTKSFPIKTYVEDMGIKNFDCVILVTSERFYEDDLLLIENIININVPIYVTRTKIDEAVERGKKRGVDEKTTVSSIKLDLQKNIGESNIKDCYLTSSDYPTKYDLGKLIADIASTLNDLKRQRFIADVGNISREIIEEKRSVAKKIVMMNSALSAANGLNPIPGLDISLDISILVKMNSEISKIYGLDKKGIRYVEELSPSLKLKSTLAKAAQFAAKYLGKEAILVLLKRFAAGEVVKEVSKYIPFVGQGIAALIGFKMTSMMGDEMINDAEKIAFELFEDISNS